MDCEKYEPLLLDELYEELDQLTSAAVKRHVAGCAHCASILSGLAATREAVSLPLVPLPDGLEERILAATREAQKVIPIRGPIRVKMSRVLSVAGSWAMRPQTAMAAVFLVMIGTSAFLIRSKNYASQPSVVSVTVAGAPATTATGDGDSESLDDKAAAAAHGPTPPIAMRPPPLATAAAPFPELAEGASSNAYGRDKAKADESSPIAALDDMTAKGAPLPAPTAMNAGAVGGAPANVAPGAQAPTGDAVASRRAGRAGADSQAQDPMSLGAAAFRGRNFAEATKQYDLAAQSGNPSAALWAAESTREGQGCAVALGRFDQLARSAAGSYEGNEASLRAARCQIAMGQLDSARERLDRLAQAPSHQQAAQQALGELNQVAARKTGGGGGAAGAAAAPKRAAAPAPRPAAQEQKKTTNTDQGF